MAQGRSTKIVSMIEWIRTSRLSIKKSFSGRQAVLFSPWVSMMVDGDVGWWEAHATPYTLHPTPYAIHPTPYTLYPTYTLHPQYLARQGVGCRLQGAGCRV